MKKSYTKILDAYGCLGVLNLTHGKFAVLSLLSIH